MSASLQICLYIEVKHTFVHFDDRSRSSKRCSSAPPEIFVEAIVAQAPEQQRRPKKKNNKSKRVITNDEDCLREFMKLAKEESMQIAREQKWGQLAVQLLKDKYSLILAAVKIAISTERTEQVTPKFREALPKKVFRELAFTAIRNPSAESLLRKMGVVRETEDSVQLWTADNPLEHPTMLTFVEEFHTYRNVYDMGAFQVMLDDITPIVLKYSDMTVNELKNTIETTFRLSSERQIMKHFGKELLTGNLSDHGIGDGSCVHLYRK